MPTAKLRADIVKSRRPLHVTLSSAGFSAMSSSSSNCTRHCYTRECVRNAGNAERAGQRMQRPIGGWMQCYLSNISRYKNGNDCYSFAKTKTKTMLICRSENSVKQYRCHPTIMMSSSFCQRIIIALQV